MQTIHLRLGSQVTIHSHNFGIVDNFVFLGTGVNTYSNFSLEMQSNITSSSLDDPKQNSNILNAQLWLEKLKTS